MYFKVICINNMLTAEIRLEGIIRYCMDKEKPNSMIHKGIWITRIKLNSRVIQLLLQPHLRVFFFLLLSHWVLSTLFDRKLRIDGLMLPREPIRVHLSNAQLLNQTS